MGSVAMRYGWAWLSILCMGCGRSTLEPGWFGDEGAAGTHAEAGRPDRGGAPGIGGTSFVGGTGVGGTGFVPTAGTTFGGMPSFGGVGGAAGEAASCALTQGNCWVDEPNCEATHPQCTGETTYAAGYGSDSAVISDVISSPDGPVAIAGYHRSSIDFGGIGNALAAGESFDPFVAELHTNGNTKWVASLGAPGVQTVTGAGFRPNGELFVQGGWDAQLDATPDLPLGTGYVSSVTSSHQLSTPSQFGTSGATSPGGVAADNNGARYLAGTFTDHFVFGTSELACEGQCGYLAKLGEDGTLLWLEAVKPSGWASAQVTRVVADDEDNVIVIGDQGSLGKSAFFQKRAANGQLVFTQEFTSSQRVEVHALAVDRFMRITVGGGFKATWQDGSSTLEGSPNAVSDAWVAQYSSLGGPLWARAYSSHGKLAQVSAAAIDPYGNVVLAGVASYLDVQGEIIDPELTNWSQAAFVLKLRSDSTKVWLQPFYGEPDQAAALTTDGTAHIWLGGSFSLGLETGDETLTTPDGRRDAFLLRLSP